MSNQRDRSPASGSSRRSPPYSDRSPTSEGSRRSPTSSDWSPARLGGGGSPAQSDWSPVHMGSGGSPFYSEGSPVSTNSRGPPVNSERSPVNAGSRGSPTESDWSPTRFGSGGSPGLSDRSPANAGSRGSPIEGGDRSPARLGGGGSPQQAAHQGVDAPLYAEDKLLIAYQRLDALFSREPPVSLELLRAEFYELFVFFYYNEDHQHQGLRRIENSVSIRTPKIHCNKMKGQRPTVHQDEVVLEDEALGLEGQRLFLIA
ncbi:hypothetical protein TYRP_015519 [Tyrophagus putrescentiae]|nr:hypothetical protein TYRP_015519 [Tyrophagus putrescentiae]